MNDLKTGDTKDLGNTVFEGINSYCYPLGLAIPDNIFAISRNVDVRTEIISSVKVFILSYEGEKGIRARWPNKEVSLV